MEENLKETSLSVQRLKSQMVFKMKTTFISQKVENRSKYEN